jgi:methionyl-tRNA formyltransferase
MPIKVCFMGSADISCNILEFLLTNQQKFNINLTHLYTKEPKQVGRGHRVIYSKIYQKALSNNLTILTPKTLKNQAIQQNFINEKFDLCLVFAYGLILPLPILNAPILGCLNIHASLLPLLRGAAPIQRSIEHGFKETGITLMYMDEGLDTGDIIFQEKTNILPTTTLKDLFLEIENLSKTILKKLFEFLPNKLPRIPQNNLQATYAPPLKKEEGLINWKETAETLNRKILAFSNYPTSYFYDSNNTLFKIISAEVYKTNNSKPAGEILDQNKNLIIQTGDNALKILNIKKEGKQTQPIELFLQGNKFHQNNLQLPVEKK